MARPSERWTSFDEWDYNGMKDRLKAAIAVINKDGLLHHAELVKGQHLSISDAFSAGQYWICFELVAEDSSLVIARVRLPLHPGTQSAISQEDEVYAMECEVSTMRFVSGKIRSFAVPEVYAYEGPGSERAIIVGAPYMLIEGFHGNTLQEVASNICDLPVSSQEHIIAQWTMVQAQLATITHPQIGSIRAIANSGDPIVGRLATAAADRLVPEGPFSTALQYFTAVGEAALRKADREYKPHGVPNHAERIGPLVFLNIVSSTDLFQQTQTRFGLNHMDLGMQNILVDDDYNFLAIIDWEFAQTAPWQVNHYPMPFPLLWSDHKIKEAVEDSNHIAHKHISQQAQTQRLYSDGLRNAEKKLGSKGSLEAFYAGLLDGPAPRIYACFSKLKDCQHADVTLVHEMLRLAFGYDSSEADIYIESLLSGHKS